MQRFYCFFLLFLTLLSCKKQESESLREGMWLAQLEAMNNELLPFNFNLKKSESGYIMDVYNAGETVRVDEIEIRNDSIKIKMPAFEGYISGTFNDSVIKGRFIKESLDRIVPFYAVYGDSIRFHSSANARVDVSGIWETKFSPDSEDEYLAKGIFTQQINKVSGTFRTNTGDYRYLEGIVDGDSLRLSTFDGAHAFLFTAKVTDSTLNGTFYSGNHFKEPFIGRRNEGFQLADEESLTFMKEGYDKLQFSFPNTEDILISLEDSRFKEKVVVVQIMGTWCPNCLDETRFLSDYVKTKKPDNFEVVALAFEYAKTKELAFKGIERLKNRVGVTYPILLAQYASSSKTKANEKLPMLNHIISYPTTIFIDKKGKVRKIHTGFNGPATGQKYIDFKEDFDQYIELLLSE
ncbi:peroxiredoxin [uncultured Eudoraea sp.]|jgi:thiol-disulfide isomerase/thioredoxin|uniref:peroxiredoxin family protein n=1 Tax=uncultured Eudoraea sp. TaxID=1035614 RepID=UPI00260D5A76|nr:TlpA disulfide reductase family protein [uncultured Eudoraea sp.]